MKKAIFKIIHTDGTSAKVSGLVNGTFGIHKDVHNKYTVTHLRTGLSVCSFVLHAQAREFADRLEKAVPNSPWETKDIKSIAKNGPVVFKIRNKVLCGE